MSRAAERDVLLPHTRAGVCLASMRIPSRKTPIHWETCLSVGERRKSEQDSQSAARMSGSGHFPWDLVEIAGWLSMASPKTALYWLPLLMATTGGTVPLSDRIGAGNRGGAAVDRLYRWKFAG